MTRFWPSSNSGCSELWSGEIVSGGVLALLWSSPFLWVAAFQMREFLEAHFEHVLACLVVLSRLADIGSTYAGSPKLKLEMNPLVRRLRWPFAWASLLLAGVAYLMPPLAVPVIVSSFMVASANLSKVAVTRAVGEDAYFRFISEALRNAKAQTVYGCIIGAALLMAMPGLLLLLLSSLDEWGFWVAFGILAYSLAIVIHSSLFAARIRRVRMTGADNANEAAGASAQRSQLPASDKV